MTFLELNTILEDHVMDMQLPPIGVPAWKREFKHVSYYRWAVNEYKTFVASLLPTDKAADIRSFLDLTENFIARMEILATMNQGAEEPFYVATDVGRNILDILEAMR